MREIYQKMIVPLLVLGAVDGAGGVERSDATAKSEAGPEEVNGEFNDANEVIRECNA